MPPGVHRGAPVDRRLLRLAGHTTGSGYRAMLSLPFLWHIRGRTIVPGRGRTKTEQWRNAVQVSIAERYPVLNRQELTALAFPYQAATGSGSRDLPGRAKEAFLKLEALGALQFRELEGGVHGRWQVLPPGIDFDAPDSGGRRIQHRLF